MSGGQDQDTSDENVAASDLERHDLYNRLRNWFSQDYDHSAEWRRDAKKDFDFAAGKQWDAADRQTMEDQRRPVITFNRVLPIIKAVAGIEINGRHETIFIPRQATEEQIKANEILTSASQWMADNCDAEDEQSEAFQDSAICGMGWTEARISYDDDPDGMYEEDRIDPLEMYWDRSARSKNLVDARRLFRVRKMTVAEARELARSIGAKDVFDSDLDAPWALGGEYTKDAKPIEERRLKLENSGGPDPQDEVHIVHAQWIERVPYWRVTDPMTGEIVELDDASFKAMEANAKAMGIELVAVSQTRKVYKQAFLGQSVIGDVMDAPCKTGFSWNCITGESDRNAGTWFGLVRVMRDPQMWANKWVSQTLHILNTTAKGGIIAEPDAFKDQREAEDTYAMPDAITWAAKGAISGGKIMQKPGVGIPTGYVNLLEFAISSIRDVTGINMELLGLRDANQPGILEAQRKQAAMTILATFFDSLQRFRKNVGRVRLYYIQEYLSDGRLIRIAGEDGMTLVPLLREKTSGDYEIIVDDAPNSPNQKEHTWAVIQQVLPAFRELLTPEAVLTILEYSPLPSKLVDAFRQMSQKPPSPEAEQQKALMMETAIADLRKKKASADKDEAQAEATRAKGLIDLAEAGAIAARANLENAAANVMSPEPWRSSQIEDPYVISPMDGPQGPMPPQMRQTPMVPPMSAQVPELPMEGGDAGGLGSLAALMTARSQR